MASAAEADHAAVAMEMGLPGFWMVAEDVVSDLKVRQSNWKRATSRMQAPAWTTRHMSG